MVKQISRQELLDLTSSGAKFKLVDVLEKDHYEKEHIGGAISLPLKDIEKKAGRFFKKDDLLIVYCASFECQTSIMAAEKLLAMGHKNVLDYKGGLKDYQEADLPLEGSLHKESMQTCPSRCSC